MFSVVAGFPDCHSTLIFPFSTLTPSPYLYLVSGVVSIDIDFTASFTVTSISNLFPSYTTVTVCCPTSVGLNVVVIISLVNGIDAASVPLYIIGTTFAFVKSKFCPYS